MSAIKPNILIVEDEDSLKDALAGRFRNFANVYTATGATDAYNLAVSYKPDLIALDIIISDGDGIELLKKIRSTNWGKDTKVIVLSNVSDRNVIEDCKKLNVMEHFLKYETNINKLVEYVKEAVSV